MLHLSSFLSSSPCLSASVRLLPSRSFRPVFLFLPRSGFHRLMFRLFPFMSSFLSPRISLRSGLCLCTSSSSGVVSIPSSFPSSYLDAFSLASGFLLACRTVSVNLSLCMVSISHATSVWFSIAVSAILFHSFPFSDSFSNSLSLASVKPHCPSISLSCRVSVSIWAFFHAHHKFE